MKEVFVIMQIGDPELDRLYAEVYEPVIRKCGLVARRVDQHNRGSLLKNEILRFVEKSTLVLADLTNERPNCYLEVGLAIGMDRLSSLVMTARHDHNVRSGDYAVGGPRVHFDLDGYPILFWNPTGLDAFACDLEALLRRRLALASSTPESSKGKPPGSWMGQERAQIRRRLQSLGAPAFSEFSFVAYNLLSSPVTQARLKKAMEEARLANLDFPFAVEDASTSRPESMTHGVGADPASDRITLLPHWRASRWGELLIVRPFDPQDGDETRVVFETQLWKATLQLIIAARFSLSLGVPESTLISASIDYFGIGGRRISSGDPLRATLMRSLRPAKYDPLSGSLDVTLGSLTKGVEVATVDLLRPLFNAFDFFEPDAEVAHAEVHKFVRRHAPTFLAPGSSVASERSPVT
jgi:hypothetical protein